MEIFTSQGTGVNDTSGKFATGTAGVVDTNKEHTGGKFATDVTGGK